MGDLSALPADREAFRAAVAKTYPSIKPGAVPNYTGQIFRFVHEMKPGDLVAYPSKRDRQVHIGRVTGPHKYDPSLDAGYPNLHARFREPASRKGRSTRLAPQ
jgi:restriction system protein